MPRQALGLIPQLWAGGDGQEIDYREAQKVVRQFNSWLATDRDLNDFAAEPGFAQATGIRFRGAEPYGAMLVAEGKARGVQLFVLPFDEEEAIALPGTGLMVGSFGSHALRDLSKPFFTVEFGKNAGLRLPGPCRFMQENENRCALIEPGS